MSNCDPADKLRNNRRLLLAMEAVGWFHMTGKARAAFLREQGGQKTGYEDRDWHKNENPPFPWDDLLDWARINFATVDSVDVKWPDTLTDFLTQHRGNDGCGLLGLLQAGHGMVSGIEKNLPPKKPSECLGQDATHLWLSSAFGQPVRHLLVNPPEVLTDAGWQALLTEIRRLLEELKSFGTQSSNDVAAWQRWREAAIGTGSRLRGAFSSTLAETRLPNNDVTLWDQSYVAAALFKSAVAGAVLKGNWTDNNLKQDTKWRLLTVGNGADHYESRAVRIGDWTGTRLALDDFFAQVQNLVEVDLAVGSLLYQDGSVAVFSFPATANQKKDDKIKDELQTWLQGEIDGFAHALGLGTPPHCQISEPTRTLVPMTAQVRQVKERLAVPLHRAWHIANSAGNSHVCPICLVRHTGRSNDKQEPCTPCKNRRRHRRDAWLDNRLGGDTIWISELADTNDRVALLTLSLDIEPWLDGSRLDALRTQAIPEWRQFNPTLSTKQKTTANPIQPDRPFASLVSYVKGKLGTYDNQDPVLQNLQAGCIASGGRPRSSSRSS